MWNFSTFQFTINSHKEPSSGELILKKKKNKETFQSISTKGAPCKHDQHKAKPNNKVPHHVYKT